MTAKQQRALATWIAALTNCKYEVLAKEHSEMLDKLVLLKLKIAIIEEHLRKLKSKEMELT